MARPTVALLVETSRAYGRGLCRGIAAFAHAHGEWNFVLQECDLRGGIPDWLPNWKGDGILCRLYDPEFAVLMADAPCPVVDIFGRIRHPDIPFLDTDADAVAEMAVRFFLNAAFDRFAYCGYPGLWFSDERGNAFTNHLQRLGFVSEVYNPPQVWNSPDVAAREALHAGGSSELESWIKSLPPRTAILACNDVRAQQLLAVAVRVGRRVPDDLAVMGVDDDEVICELTNPRLTSIRPDAYGLGYTAAYWLHLLMQGAPLPRRSLLMPPLGITERASTDVVASNDPLFVEAARFIRSNVKLGIDAKAVVSQIGCSRSTLEGRFRSLLGRSIKDEITRVRVMRARILLRETRMTVEQIASACGFATASHFSRIFKEFEQTTPGRFRSEWDPCGPTGLTDVEVGD
jgi:LacI family transcriptional regulator